MLTGNKGEWSEPYALLKLLADGKLYLGEDNFQKVKDLFYPITKVLRHEKDRIVDFSYEDNLVVITDGVELFRVPICDFVKNAELCFSRITSAKKGNGSFPISEIEDFLSSFSISTLKAKSKLKNDITIQIEDPKTFLSPSLGFSVKSQLGSPATLLNASGVTNFTYTIKGTSLSEADITKINATKEFSDKLAMLQEIGCFLEFDKVENDIFKSNLQTIDYNFDQILSRILLLYYSNNTSSENTIEKFVLKVMDENPINYNLSINPSMYELIMKKFLSDYALGMRAGEVWMRNYQATGGYLVVREDGEIICYHFYFTKNFEDYLFKNTKLETPSSSKHSFGNIYTENGIAKIKLNLQIRFIK